MKRLLITLTSAGLALAATEVLASPQKLVTHNLTNVESNAFVAGTISSRYPTRPHSDGKVSWTEVKMACFGHIMNGKCDALVKMETNTPHPINLGWVKLDLESGDITPKSLTANGYTLLVNGPGETTLIKN